MANSKIKKKSLYGIISLIDEKYVHFLSCQNYTKCILNYFAEIFPDVYCIIPFISPALQKKSKLGIQ